MLCVRMIGIVYYNIVMYSLRRTLNAKFQSQTLDTYTVFECNFGKWLNTSTLKILYTYPHYCIIFGYWSTIIILCFSHRLSFQKLNLQQTSKLSCRSYGRINFCFILYFHFQKISNSGETIPKYCWVVNHLLWLTSYKCTWTSRIAQPYPEIGKSKNYNWNSIVLYIPSYFLYTYQDDTFTVYII